MIIRYSFIEMYNDTRFILVRLLYIINNLLDLIFILQKIEIQNSKKISIEVDFGFDTNHKAEYCVDLRQMIHGDSFSTYILKDKENNHVELQSLDKKNIIKFLNRILECFIDENMNASNPYLIIDEEKFDDYCDFLKDGHYYSEN